MYDPLARENEYDNPVIAPDFIPFVKLTYHAVPDGRLDSVKVAVYFTSENETETELAVVNPLIVNDPGVAW